jgi:DNA (cytosine-5)-methyltransferase 1
MRPPVFRATFDPSDMMVDNFAGGGGASEGIKRALRPPDVAINHSPIALAMHRVNHPETRHYCEDIWTIDPKELCSGRRVGLAWFSPDCTFFSKARGAKPLRPEERKVRGLAWVVPRWIRAVWPRVILLENVEEFEDWGPLGENGLPDKGRAGRTFRAWIAQIRNLGYDVEWRPLVAADSGSPTIRKRLYVVARCDGQPIVWPEPTHGKGRPKPWRTAAEIIDWSLPVRSIFGRKRPLAEATMRRIAKGLERYVFNSARPFIIPVAHQGDLRAYTIDEPVRTIDGSHRGAFALVDPFIIRHGHYSTRTGAGIEEGKGCGTFRGQPLDKPLGTVCGTNDKDLICPIITKYYGDPDRAEGGGVVVGHDVARPLGTVTTRDHHALAAAFLTKFYGTSTGAPLDEPLPTITANDRAGGHLAEVRAFLIKYYGAQSGQQQSLFDPLHTVTSKARFGLVVVHGELYRIVDIGMRMLSPRELFSAQGFRPDYVIDFEYEGRRITKSDQTELCGNSQSPDVAEALARVNTVGERSVAA